MSKLSTTRSRRPAKSEIDLEVPRRSGADGRRHVLVQVHHQERRHRKHNKTVTFMPKPIFSDNGSGMHTHISLWKGDQPLFAGSGYAGSATKRSTRLAEFWRHAPAILAFTNPTTNSYKRLVPGYEAPGQPGLLATQPVGRLSHPDVQRQSQIQANRVPLPRSEFEPVPGVFRADDGRTRWHPEQDPPR